jgi:hypothetical protein
LFLTFKRAWEKRVNLCVRKREVFFIFQRILCLPVGYSVRMGSGSVERMQLALKIIAPSAEVGQIEVGIPNVG